MNVERGRHTIYDDLSSEVIEYGGKGWCREAVMGECISNR